LAFTWVKSPNPADGSSVLDVSCGCDLSMALSGGPIVVPYLSVPERAARGKAARSAVPRSRHSVFEPAAARPDPVGLLERQAETRVQELVPIRYGRMLVSPFTFFRGAAMIMAHDLAPTPRSGFNVQCCGDAHLSNFGMFASPERRLMFDINDFDETLAGPWEWDVKRLGASVLIAARDNGYRVKDQRRAVLATVAQYRMAMREFARMGNLAVWYARLEIESLLAERVAKFKPGTFSRTEKMIAKARTRDSMSAFSKLTRLRNGQVEIVDQSPLIVPLSVFAPGPEREELLRELRGLLHAFRDSLDHDRRTLLEQFRLVDFARKVVGVGSVGTRAWIALLLGHDDNDPLFLQMKQAEGSVLEEPLGASEFENHAQRVVAGQRRMQATSDIFLGWVRAESPVDGQLRDFYGRQLKDWKGSVEIDQMSPRAMAIYGKLCGWTLARAHARTGDRVAIASYLGSGPKFDRAILEFSDAYAAQNERDYRRLVAAVESGTLSAQVGI
jgi:uncharacterized protein (DUF2252 family)